jgi:hypothetical protein
MLVGAAPHDPAKLGPVMQALMAEAEANRPSWTPDPTGGSH